ncbi:MAG: helix-turn-helix domain-containing protein [Anaerolineae bacterium]
MEAVRPPEFIKLLANDLRWSLLKALTISDFQVNELVAQLQQPMNLVSYHLKKMRADALVTTRRSEAKSADHRLPGLDLNTCCRSRCIWKQGPPYILLWDSICR